ncbi:MAG: dTMP kinase [Chloroflexi bacterium]|nr:dTMP kinase [Chloroflexota bacterium]
MADGKFIAIEGTDGSGITTQAVRLRDWIDASGSEVLLTKEPTTGPIGAVIRQALTRRIDFASEEIMALLFAADRLDHLATIIEPLLRDSVHVISDRYVLSSLAYQTERLPVEWIREVNAHVRRPDLVLYLSVPPRINAKRMGKKRWGLERYEETATLEKVRDRFGRAIDLLRSDGVEVAEIDGTLKIDEVHAEIIRVVEPVLSNGAKPQLSLFTPPKGSPRSRRGR